MIDRPNEFNSFVLRASFKNSDGTDITFTCAANTLLNNSAAGEPGDVKVFVYKDDKATSPNYATHNDGVNDILLNGINCFSQDENGKYAYYTVRGGLPDGQYKAVIQLQRKNSGGQWDPRLSTKEIIVIIEDQNITFT